MNKEQLKEYLQTVSIFAPTQEQQDYVFQELIKLGIETKDITKPLKNYYFIQNILYTPKFKNFAYCDRKTFIYFSDFKKLIKELEPEVKDFEVNSDGIITKINNYKSIQLIHCIIGSNLVDVSICALISKDLEFYVKLGLVATNKEVLEKKLKHMEIEQKIRNIADKLNNGIKIDWNNDKQIKYSIFLDGFDNHKGLNYIHSYSHSFIGCIYCLSDKFLEECIKEIGEQDLIIYLKG